MNMLARLIDRAQPDAVRTSARIREELEALPQPSRHSEMLADISRQRAELAKLSGPELKAGEREVADLEATAATYRAKHDRVFVQAAGLADELVEVQQRERQAIIATRLEFHNGPEAEDYKRRAREAAAAAREMLAQRIATHLLAKAWGIDIPWTFGFPPVEAERRAAEIVAELTAA